MDLVQELGAHNSCSIGGGILHGLVGISLVGLDLGLELSILSNQVFDFLFQPLSLLHSIFFLADQEVLLGFILRSLLLEGQKELGLLGLGL